MTQKRKARMVWLGRNDGGEYQLGERKNKWSGCGDFGKHHLVALCDSDFEHVTGYHLQPGEIRKVRIHIEDVV